MSTALVEQATEVVQHSPLKRRRISKKSPNLRLAEEQQQLAEDEPDQILAAPKRKHGNDSQLQETTETIPLEPDEGGQILRMACSLSVLTRKPIRLNNIRAGRSSPGLRAQHKTGLELGRDISNGKLWGVTVGSGEVKFHPGKLSGGVYSADTQTAGSIALLIQVALPCTLFCPEPVELNLYGGTNADMAPQMDYVITVFEKVVQKFGVEFECVIRKRGYFPRGGGHVYVKVNPINSLKAVQLMDRGEIKRIWGRSFVAGNVPLNVAVETGSTAVDLLKAEFPSIPVEMINYQEIPRDAVGNGSGINIFAETWTGCIFGGSGLGKRHVTPSQVAKSAVDELLTSLRSNVCVDAHSQDQVIIFMALAKGRSSIRCGPITLHTKTAIHIAERLTQAKFEIENFPDGTNAIHCDGIGYERDRSRAKNH